MPYLLMPVFSDNSIVKLNENTSVQSAYLDRTLVEAWSCSRVTICIELLPRNCTGCEK